MRLDSEIEILYRHARNAWISGDKELALTLHRRLRAEHSIELWPEVELPAIMRFVHALGSVLGRATYADHLVVYSGVNVGSDVDGGRPTFTGPCVLFPGSKIIGNVTVGANVWVTAGTTVEARPGAPITIPDDCVVYNACPPAAYTSQEAAVCAKPTKRSVVERFFSDSNRQGE